MKQTNNYQLNQWEKTDRILMEDFNEDNRKIDEALAEEKAARETLTAAVTKCGNCKIVYGSYTGTETYGSENPSTLAFASKPLFIVIRSAEGNFGTGADQKLILVYGSTWCKSTDTSSNSHNFVTWSGNSVSWYCTNSAYNQMNQSERVYWYVAFLATVE